MNGQTTPTLPICLSGSLGLAGLGVLSTLLAGMFALWSFSCLGIGVISNCIA